MANDVDFKNCPVGIKNGSDIQHLSETVDIRLNALMTRIEEKIDNMNDKIHSEFTQLNNRLDKLDKKVTQLDEKLEGVDNLETFIEDKISDNTKNKVFNFVKWVVVVLLGGTAVTVLGSLVLKLFAN